MVNANVIISVSAVLVALLLTIVVVMRTDGDPTDNYSVKVSGTATTDGVSYNSEMYYCIGESCVFYNYMEDTPVDYIFSVGDSFPGYFALVGFTDEVSGETYVTEHSIGYTFIYKDGALTKCLVAEDLDTETLGDQVASFTDAFNSEDKSIKDEEGNVVFQLTGYALDADPSDDVPTVNGHGVPSVYECKKLWAVESAAACSEATGTECKPEYVFNPADVPAEVSAVSSEERRTGSTVEVTDTEGEDLGERRLQETGERELAAWWEGGSQWGLTGMDGANLAQWVYKNPDSPGLPSGWTEWRTCEKTFKFLWWETGRSTARFAYKYPSGGRRGHMAIVFAGSNDLTDWMYNAHLGWHSTYHQGFHDYVLDVRGCLDSGVSQLKSWGIPVTYVIGHSLGGAAATTYNHMRGYTMPGSKVITFGAPKSRRNSECSQPGYRFFHNRDPVASNIGFKVPVFNINIGILGAFRHDVQNAVMVYNKNTNTCNSWGYRWHSHRSCGWLGCWSWPHLHKDRCTGYVQSNHMKPASTCGEVSATTLAIDKHGMDSYKSHNIGSITP